jgi:hypothetical protein
MDFASASDDEGEVESVDAGFGAKRFGTVEAGVGMGANMLLEVVGGLGEKRLDVVGGEAPDVLLVTEAAFGGKRLEA